jgi:lipoprotein NlpI
MGTLAYRKINNTAAANHMLDLCNQHNVKDWPYPALQYLRGEITADQMFGQADNNDKMTEARTYAGIESAILGKKQAAIDNLNWVRHKGNREFCEYQIALSELKRFGREKKVMGKSS